MTPRQIISSTAALNSANPRPRRMSLPGDHEGIKAACHLTSGDTSLKPNQKRQSGNHCDCCGDNPNGQRRMTRAQPCCSQAQRSKTLKQCQVQENWDQEAPRPSTSPGNQGKYG